MKNYLANYLNEYHYEKSDADFLLNQFDKLASTQEFVNAVNLYNETYQCDFNKVNELTNAAADSVGIHEYTAKFLVLAIMTKKLKDYYLVKGYDLNIYKANLNDLKYKLDECKTVKGVVGIFTDWFKYFLALKIFSFNRLQFELTCKEVVGKDNKDLPDGELISIHIPRTLTPLTPESVDCSLKAAKKFFKPLFKDDKMPFVCGSYLMHSSMLNAYKEGSNLKSFASRFKIVYETDYANYSELWRLFDVEVTNVELLPEKSSLHKAVKKHVVEGKPIGYAIGVFYY